MHVHLNVPLIKIVSKLIIIIYKGIFHLAPVVLSAISCTCSVYCLHLSSKSILQWYWLKIVKHMELFIYLSN